MASGNAKESVARLFRNKRVTPLTVSMPTLSMALHCEEYRSAEYRGPRRVHDPSNHEHKWQKVPEQDGCGRNE